MTKRSSASGAARSVDGSTPGSPPSIDESAPEMVVVHLLRAVTVEFNMFGSEFAAANGLHLTDLRAIIELLDAERAGVAASPGWLGARLALNSASVTALLDRLERLGQVRREHDPTDRRRLRLVVSAAAKELGWAFFGPLIDGVIDVARSFDEEELATVRRFLAAVADAASARREAQRPARVLR